MKRIVLLLIAAATMSACSNSEFRIYDDVGSVLYITNNGFTDLTLEYEQSPVFEVWVYRAGSMTGSIGAGIKVSKAALVSYNVGKGTNYVLLPEECYSFDTDEKTFSGDDRLAGFEISLNADNIADLAPGMYVLPIAVFSDHVCTKKGMDAVLLGFDVR